MRRTSGRLGKSRRKLYRGALADYVARREPDAETIALDKVDADVGANVDDWIAEAARRTLERSDW